MVVKVESSFLDGICGTQENNLEFPEPRETCIFAIRSREENIRIQEEPVHSTFPLVV
jgi:hypothetical protein